MIYVYDELEKINYKEYLEMKSIVEMYNEKIINDYIKYEKRLYNVLSIFLILIFLYNNKLIEEINTYSVDKNNKPIMKNIGFNISYCSKAVVVAIEKTGNIGVDVEEKIENYEELKKYILSDNELKIKEINEKTFRKLWTLKECFVKYEGKGLYIEPIEIDFSKYVENSTFSVFGLHFKCYENNDYSLSICCKKTSICKKITNEELKRYIKLLK